MKVFVLKTARFVTAGVLAGILAVCYFCLRESPQAIGAVEAAPSPTNVYGETAAPGLAAILGPL